MSSKASTFRSAAVSLLKPFVRFCLKRGLRIQDMLDSLKRAILEIAKEEIEKKGDIANISRLSVLTGLQRKDIKKLSTESSLATGSVDLLAKIIGQWQSSSKFKGSNGKPRALSIVGNDSEFSELVRSVSYDVSPYTVLFGLEQAGAIKKKNNQITLCAPLYLATKDIKNSLSALSEDISDLTSAVEENVFVDPKIPNLHLTTVYDNLCEQNAEELKTWVLKEGTAFQEKIRNHLKKFDIDSNPKLRERKGGVKMVIGTFSLLNAVKESEREN